MAKYMVLNRGSKRVKVFRKMKLPFMEMKIVVMKQVQGVGCDSRRLVLCIS